MFITVFSKTPFCIQQHVVIRYIEEGEDVKSFFRLLLLILSCLAFI